MQEPITRFIRQLEAGDQDAARPLWDHFFPRLVALARKRLGNTSRRDSDEEDVALSALDSAFRGIQARRFQKLSHRDDLWRLLATITARKAVNRINRINAIKRGGGNTRGDSDLKKNDSATDKEGFDQFESPEPTPEFAVMMAEECRRLLNLLDDDELRRIALWKMEGYTNEEIGQKLDGISLTTVEGRLRLIRATWKEEAGR